LTYWIQFGGVLAINAIANKSFYDIKDIVADIQRQLPNSSQDYIKEFLDELKETIN